MRSNEKKAERPLAGANIAELSTIISQPSTVLRDGQRLAAALG